MTYIETQECLELLTAYCSGETPNRLIPKAEVQLRLGGLSDTTLWRMWRSGDLPAPVRVSRGRSMWLENEIESFIKSRASARALNNEEN